MSMNGIDIASHQAGINLGVVPCDFVIIKATQGTSYVNPDCNRAYQQAKAAGKCLGVYHYASGGDAKAEAEFFLKNIRGYIGETLLALDWESDQNPLFGKNDAVWVKTWLDYVYSKTGVKPLLYTSQSVMNRFADIGDYGLWIAQYADNNTTGYQATPWNEGAYHCVIRQYSSHGRLSGWSGDLDLDKFYGDQAAWDKYAGTKVSVQVPGNPVNNVGLYYRTHCQTYGWLDPVHDGQTAGTTGKSKRMEALKIDTRKIPGLKLKVKAHIQSKGWVDYGYITHDTVIGTTGKTKRLEALDITAEGLPAGKKLLYRLHLQKFGWTGWTSGQLGTVGMALRAEAIQMKIV